MTGQRSRKRWWAAMVGLWFVAGAGWGMLPETEGPSAPVITSAATSATSSAATPAEPGRLPVALPTVVPPSEHPPAELVVPVAYQALPRPEAAISLNWAGPPVVRVGRPQEYCLRVRNESSQPVQKVTVQVRAPKEAKITQTVPAAKMVDGIQLWEFDSLDTQETRELKLTVIAGQSGETTCQAWVTLTGTSGMKLQAQAPKLSAKVESPAEIPQGQPIPVEMSWVNIGDCDIEAGQLKLFLQGQAQPIFEQTIATNSRGAAGSCRFTLPRSPEGVEARFRLELSEGSQVLATASSQTKILKPALQTTLSGPAELIVGMPGQYQVTIRNTGAVPLQVTPQCTLPFGWQYTQAPSTEMLSMRLLPPGGQRDLMFQAVPRQGGRAVFTVAAAADYGLVAPAEHVTLARGIAALRMELIDQIDPVARGQDTVYEVRVVNTGTQSDHNVVIHCTLPRALKFQNATGPVEHTLTELNGVSMVRFAPIRELSPGTEARFRIVVKAQETGDIRFKATMNSPSLSTSVVKEESTRVFGN